MRRLVRALGSIALMGVLCAAGGCYGSAMSIARCASKYKACESIERDFASGSTLRVRNEFGPISVSAGEAEECLITGRVYVRAPTKRESQEIGAQVRIVAEPNEGVLLVRVTTPDLEGDRSAWVDLNIAVPSRAHVDCETEFGRIKVAGIEGDIHVNTEFGPVICDEITSGHVTAQTDFGSINVKCTDACPADLVADVRTEYGKIRFRAPEAFEGDIEVKTEFGSTRAKIPIAGRDKWTDDHKIATTGSGNGRLSLQTEFGSIRLR